MTTDNSEQKARKPHLFQPGQSGNPKGMPKGTRHKATQAALLLLSGELQALTRKAVDMALGGDIAALRLCLERLIPPRREHPLPALDLPEVSTALDLPKLTQAIMQIAASGELTPSEASSLATIAGVHVKALDALDLDARLTRLEELANAKGK